MERRTFIAQTAQRRPQSPFLRAPTFLASISHN